MSYSKEVLREASQDFTPQKFLPDMIRQGPSKRGVLRRYHDSQLKDLISRIERNNTGTFGKRSVGDDVIYDKSETGLNSYQTPNDTISKGLETLRGIMLNRRSPTILSKPKWLY